MEQELKNKIIKEYQAGGTLNSVAKENGISWSSVLRLLKKNSIPRHTKRVLTPEQDKEIIRLYVEEKKSAEEIRDIFKVANWTVLAVLRRNKIKARKWSEYKKYKVNENIFDKFDTDAKLWLLGWIYSDGNVKRNFDRVGICTHINDIEVHKLFNEVLESDYPATRQNNAINTYCYSHKIGARLNELGCIPNKSLVVKYPDFFTEEWQHWSFLRGILEGDGSIGIKNNRRAFDCSIASGSSDFLKSVADILKKYLDIDCKIEGYKLRVLGGHLQALKFLDKLYNNGNCYFRLERKYQIYLTIKESSVNPRPNAQFGVKKSPELVAKMRKSMILSHPPVFLKSPNQEICKIQGSMDFCKEIGSWAASLLELKKGKISHLKGWTLATPAEIEAATLSNTLIEKNYY